MIHKYQTKTMKWRWRYTHCITKLLQILFGYSYHIRPSMISLLDKKDLIGVEIGSQSGFNARSMLDTLDIKTLYLIDPYSYYPDLVQKYNKLDESYLTAKKRLKDYKDKVIFVKKKSEDAVNDIPNNIDFIYIDGNHAYNYVKKDIELYYQKIKQGGIISGHDFYATQINNVCLAVIEFAQKHNIKLNGLDRDWWFFK